MSNGIPGFYTFAFNIRDRNTSDFLYVSEDWKENPEQYQEEARAVLERIAAERGVTPGEDVYIEPSRKKNYFNARFNRRAKS